jgi:hypothetical protein
MDFAYHRRAMAKGLRKAHKYHKPNPLCGPAKMFDAIADRMRAGDSVKECMADYGLKFKRSNAKSEPTARLLRRSARMQGWAAMLERVSNGL